jgi:hypothetical protein
MFSQNNYIMTTSVIDTNKMSKLGLRRKPAYDEIIGMIDDSDKKQESYQIGMLHFLKVALKEVFLMVRMLWNN